MRHFIVFASVSLLALSAALVAPTLALAGGCPTCTSSADCTPSGSEPAFCVLHDSEVGCGAEVMLCCPGQGCAITTAGRPSCEGTSCTVVGEDGGVPDAGPMDTDAGPMDTDGGATATDGGTTTGTDGGGSAGDGGGMVVRTDGGSVLADDGGCGCRVAGGTKRDAGGIAMALAMVGLLVVRRRRR